MHGVAFFFFSLSLSLLLLSPQHLVLSHPLPAFHPTHQILDQNIETKQDQRTEITKLKKELEALTGGLAGLKVEKKKKGRSKRGFGAQQL